MMNDMATHSNTDLECSPLVLIKWEDSRQPTSNWIRLSDLAEHQKPVVCVSVGWLIRDTVEVKVICQNMGDIDREDEMQTSGDHHDPARCVLSIQKLEEVREFSCRPSADHYTATVSE